MCRTSLPTPAASLEAARAAFDAYVADEDFRDNYREAFTDDAAAMAAYEEALDRGCCGFADKRYQIGDRVLRIGCNYGH